MTDTIIKYDPKQKTVTRRTNKDVNFHGCFAVQVKYDIFAIKLSEGPTRLTQYSNLEGVKILISEKAAPPKLRKWSSVVNFADEFIFVIAGITPKKNICR